MRGRSYSYSPSPPARGYGRRYRSRSPRRRGGRDLPTSLLVRNLRHDCTVEDLHRPFGRFGPLKDVYLPRDYHTGEPRGFGFVQFVDPADAADAKRHMDGEILLGRELTVVFAEENRKKPAEMKARERARGRAYERRRSLDYSRSPRYRHSYSRSPHFRCSYSRSPGYRRSYSRSLRYSRSYSRSPSYYSHSPRRHYSRSVSPTERRYREPSYSRSPSRGLERSSRGYSEEYSK